MKVFGGWHFPDQERHLIEWMQKVNQVVDGRQAYQHHKLLAALSHVRRFNFAIDVGGHIGLWSFYLAKKFNFVDAFEPVPAHRECFRKNVTAPTVTLHEAACGNAPGTISMHVGTDSSGDTFPDPSKPGDVPVVRIDDKYDEDVTVDFIKLDCEGFELFALQGAEQLILRSKPVICVEQKKGKASKFGLGDTDAVEWLKDRGAVLKAELSGDYILAW